MHTLRPAQPMPWSARPSRRTGKLARGAPVHMALPMTVMMMAAWTEARRPKTSAIWPQKGMNAAEVRLKAETIQFSWEIALKSVAMVGRAVAVLEKVVSTKA